jgi:hypothetical protein
LYHAINKSSAMGCTLLQTNLFGIKKKIQPLKFKLFKKEM